jgi:hypothetical protein
MLFASRLASFALVPVAAGFECRRAAEAVADFVRLGAAGAPATDPASTFAIDWRVRHERQLGFAGTLQGELDIALKAVAGKQGLDAVEPLLAALAAEQPQWDPAAGRIGLTGDPFPKLLGHLLGRDDGADAAATARVLAAMMAFYHGGGRLTRQRSESGCALKAAAGRGPGAASPGDEAARWLFDDEMLLSTALGLL